MVLSNLNNRVELEKLHPLMPRLFEFLEHNNPLELPVGIHEIVGKELFINNQAPEDLFTAESAPIEVHRKYIDVQVVLQGKETMGWKPMEEVAEWRGEYDEEKDVRFSDERCEHYVTLKAGELVVFFPNDGHAPLIGASDEPLRKFIAKLRVQ